MGRKRAGLSRGRSLSVRSAGGACAVLLVVCSLILLAAGDALAGDRSRPASPSDPTGHGYTLGEDWTHVLQVVANLRAVPPTEPLIVLLGDSIARECTVSDAVWTSQIAEAGGPAAEVYNLSSRNRTLAENIAIVKALPRVPAVVIVGVSLCSFTSPRTSVAIQLPAPTATLPPYTQHPYGEGSILPDEEKIRLADLWLKTRYPKFRRNFDSCARLLPRLIGVCRDRGFRPVLLEMPFNTAVIGHRFDKPVARYRTTCRAVATRRQVPFVRILTRAGLTSRDFADLWHIVEPGRSVCQRLLSARSATLLQGVPQAQARP